MTGKVVPLFASNLAKEQVNEMAGDEIFEVDIDVKSMELLLAASLHDVESLRGLLKSQSPNVPDPDTGHTALHAAIAACVGNTDEKPIDEEDMSTFQAETILKILFENGAIWNDLDYNNETPGCLAWRLGLKRLYEIIVDAGVRAELLLNLLDEYEPLPDESGEDGSNDEDVSEDIRGSNLEFQSDGAPIDQSQYDTSTLNENYLRSSLFFSDSRLLDSSANGVMMSWETEIMRKSAAHLLPKAGLRILNIGHGMGIFDSIAQEKLPASHHIIEAHPDVLSKMRQSSWIPSSDEAVDPDSAPKNVTVHEGRWQDILPQLQSQNCEFDAIFFDTFAESYSDFREFFSEYVIGLLDPAGSWSFFHGLGADRQVCYDVYTKVVEMDLFEAGFDMEWETVDIPKSEGELQGESNQQGDAWEGVRRKYWSCDVYRLPVCRFIA